MLQPWVLAVEDSPRCCSPGCWLWELALGAVAVGAGCGRQPWVLQLYLWP